jgi:hypothetical protein
MSIKKKCGRQGKVVFSSRSNHLEHLTSCFIGCTVLEEERMHIMNSETTPPTVYSSSNASFALTNKTFLMLTLQWTYLSINLEDSSCVKSRSVRCVSFVYSLVEDIKSYRQMIHISLLWIHISTLRYATAYLHISLLSKKYTYISIVDTGISIKICLHVYKLD